MVAEVGVGRTTHRAVAARAGVPLGATTYYYPTLSDLIAAGLELAAQQVDAEVAALASQVRTADDVPGALSRMAAESVTDRPRALLEYELYLAAARTPSLRPLARQWIDGLHAVVAPHTGPAAATAIIALVDGAVLQSVVTGDEVAVEPLASAISTLMPS
ncbi:TetR/AcrR family transcriptional regulator [Dactylosporangium sucinum]|uniref:EbrA repressor n=1 Tax=Dactylosporangium sucinum TaxID=1424081 RepID=A0A917TU59_9ACTN|nr:TetR family transcriptional regulator [Dactylosporangium sucinum]GGM37753.1 ebrA repressor [Dactylosporangium sucinum]